MLQLASYYGFPDLEDHCRNLASRFIDVANVLALFDTAIELGEDRIVEQSLEFIKINATATISQPSWLTLCQLGVEKVLALDVIDCSECFLFDRTLDWIAHNCHNDKEKERVLLSGFLPRIRLTQLSVKDLLEKVKPLVSSTQVHFAEYVDALEYKLSPMHYTGDAEFCRSRKPYHLGRISLNVPASALDGWELVLEQDARIPLDEEKLRSLSSNAHTYICMGERLRGASTLAVIAVGHLDVALRRSSSLQHFFPDGSIYWCNAPQQLFGFAPSPDQRTPMDMSPAERDRKVMWHVSSSSSSNIAGSPLLEFGDGKRTRFIYVR